MNSILSQFRRGVGLQFCLVALTIMGLSFSTFLRPVLQSIQQSGNFLQGYHEQLTSLALSSDILIAFLPVLATLPLSASYLEDIKSKFAGLYLIRENFAGYLLSNVAACWLCGGGAVLFGCLGVWGVPALVFSPMERATERYTSIAPQIVIQLVLLFLNSGLWAIMGMTMSTIMESKYIVYASPFIVYYLLVILYERYFPDAWLLSPKNWLNPEIWPYGVGSAALFLLELTFLCGLVFYIRGKRRLEQL